MYFIISLLVLGLFLSVAPIVLWSKRFGNQYIEVDLLPLRRRYRSLSTFGLMTFFVAGLHMIELMDLDMSSTTLWIVIPACIMSSNQILFEPYFTSTIVDDLKDFCLYLRPFDPKTNSKFFARGGLLLPESIEKLLGESLNKRIAKFYCIGDPNAAIPTTLNASHIYASDDDWKSVVEKLTSKSKLTILRIMKTDGCLWEMKHCISSCLDRTIFLTDSDDGMLLLNKFLIDANLEIEIPNIAVGTSPCLALFYSDSRWQVVDIRTKKDVDFLIDCFVESHSYLLTELAHKMDISGVFMQPFKTKGIRGVWRHYLIFLMQPIWYIIYNRWPRFWKYIMLGYMAVILIMLYMLLDYLYLFMSLFILSYLIFMWLAPRITIAFNPWGSESLTEIGNKVLFKWMCIYILLILIMTLGVQ